jgi:hypothetical protein
MLVLLMGGIYEQLHSGAMICMLSSIEIGSSFEKL